MVVGFAVNYYYFFLKWVSHREAAPTEDGDEEKDPPGVAEPHSVRCKSASRLAGDVSTLKLMENLSCDVLAWRAERESERAREERGTKFPSKLKR